MKAKILQYNSFLSKENQSRTSEGSSNLKKVRLTYEESTPTQESMYVK